MKALTVQQPWAWAIVHGQKDVENRTQAWSYRGPLAIHAGQRWSERGEQTVLRLTGKVVTTAAMGAIIGVVDLVEVHVAADGCCDSPWGEREYGDGRPGFERVRRRDIVHLVLERPRSLEVSIPCRGALGLWTPPAEVLAELEAQLSAASAADEPHHQRDDADQHGQLDEEEQDLVGAHAADDQSVHGRDGTR